MKSAIEKQSMKKPDMLAKLGLLYLCSQTGLLFYWVYFRFDWNLVEPITYLLGYATTWLGLASYLTMGTEFTFDAMRTRLSERAARKSLQASGFQVEEYMRLQTEVESLRQRVIALSECPAHDVGL
eukprot:CAMPEP_0176415428 /NCGR_PEP_ID=MMETSP0127-20121128/5804_1 /TAXON_ID=938130 /ORGANISM="Platyophrya macrostoma, Strain WH" /LENGTH=125 /DNA_ID=CAMNT_0017795429 /DNA_START=300 /DNA_END=677 /DNA_ORIENTATION=+